MATWRACSAICPRWMPSVASARIAARFCARPTAAITSLSSRGRRDAQNLERGLGDWVGPRRAADDAHGQRQLQATIEDIVRA